MPEVIISPQSALNILKGTGNFKVIRIELASYLKTVKAESKDFEPEYYSRGAGDIPLPPIHNSGDHQKGKSELCIYPYKAKITDNKYEYKLVWDIEGYGYQVDAATGEELSTDRERGDEVMI